MKPLPGISCWDITCIFVIHHVFPKDYCFIYSSGTVEFYAMSHIQNMFHHSIWSKCRYLICSLLLVSTVNQSVQHTTCCTCMGCSEYVGSLLGFNSPWISLSVWMFLLTVSHFTLFFPKHFFCQFLVYGHKPFLYSVAICQWPTTAHSASSPALCACTVPHIWFLFSNHPTYKLLNLHGI